MTLRAEAIEFSFGRGPVLAGVSLEVRDRELLGIVGPNGAGKSTLLACLHGARRPQAGKVELDGRDLRTLSDKAIARTIAVVPQRCDVPFPVSVADFVRLGRYAHASWLRGASAGDREVVDASLAAVQLTALAGRSVNELSGGEFRRALVAQALAQEPRILLLDEPVQQLDVRHQLEVMEFARAFAHRAGCAGLVVLHELGLAARYCDRLIMLHQGRVVATGDAETVLSTANLRAAFGIHAEIERSAATGTIQVVPVAPAEPGNPHVPSPP